MIALKKIPFLGTMLSTFPLLLLLVVFPLGCGAEPSNTGVKVEPNQFYWKSPPGVPGHSPLVPVLANFYVSGNLSEGYKDRYATRFYQNGEYYRGTAGDGISHHPFVQGIFIALDETDQPVFENVDRSLGRRVRLVTPTGQRFLFWDGESRPIIRSGDLSAKDASGVVSLCEVNWEGVREDLQKPFGRLRVVFSAVFLPLSLDDHAKLSQLTENESMWRGRGLGETEDLALVDFGSWDQR